MHEIKKKTNFLSKRLENLISSFFFNFKNILEKQNKYVYNFFRNKIFSNFLFIFRNILENIHNVKISWKEKRNNIIFQINDSMSFRKNKQKTDTLYSFTRVTKYV